MIHGEGQRTVYVPARRDEMVHRFKASALAELSGFRWRLFKQRVREGDYAGALDVAARAFDEEAERYSLLSRPHVSAPDRACLYLASIFGRLDVIDRAIALEELALREANRPYQPVGYSIESHNGVEGDGEMQVRHERDVARAREVHEHRLAQALEHRADYERFRAILEAVRSRPGIRQVDLSEVVLDRESKAVTRMVDQLESTDLVATKRVGNRIGVWPAGHAEGPTRSERREPGWSWAEWEDPEAPPPAEWLDPAGTIVNIEALIGLVDETAGLPGTDEGRRPTPLDFLHARYSHQASPSLTKGHPVHYDPDHFAIAIWGHQDLAESSAIAERIILDGGPETTDKQKAKWLLAETRHTHMERMPSTHRFGSPGWLLREVAEPTSDSVPVTAFTASGAVVDPDKAAASGAACWLRRRKVCS